MESERYSIARDPIARGGVWTRTQPVLSRAALALIATWLCAVAVQSAQVRDVRVGEHPGYTRIVFEMDSDTPYTILGVGEGPISNELRVDLEAQSFRRVLTSRSELVESVRVEPGAEGSVVRIQLRDAPVTIDDMVLGEPHRIVLDLHRAELEAPAPPPESAAAPVPEVQVELRPGQDPFEALETPVGPGDDVALEMMPEPEPAAEAEEPEAVAELEEPAEPDASSQADPALSEAAEASEEEAFWAETEEIVEEGVVAASPPESSGRPKRQGAAAADRADVAGEEQPGRRGRARSEAEAAARSRGLLGLLTSPTVLAALLLIGAVAVFLLMRPRRPSHPEPLPDFDPGPEPVVEATAEDGMREMAMPIAEEAETEAETFEAAGSIFDAPEPEPPAAPEPLAAEPESFEPVSEPPLRERAVPAQTVHAEEFEHRIEELEKRVSELLDVRERLERQLAAQTEELRVQRAAIARTQRVLRTLTRPEDVATEPAPRA